MDVQLLEDIGLTKAQSLAYQALVEHGGSTAPAIAQITNESRSNAYKLLDRLCDLGLATKDESGTKVHYFPTSPTALEQFIQKQTAEVQLRERKLNAALPSMLDFFFTHSEQPAIRFFQGEEGIKKIFRDMLATGQNIYLLRTPADIHFYDEAFFAEFRKRRARLGIKTSALTPDVASAIHNIDVDKQNNFYRTWIDPESYTANVEWDIYGSKVALISYGEEAMGIIIESPQIAESFRQVFQLACNASSAATNTRGLVP
jgi:sugar-specific transcriptional regulator TrmB